MKALLSLLRKQIRHQEIALVMFGLSICLLKFPLQHYFPLARFQHYGLCLYLWSLGFVFQTIWSWRKLSWRGRGTLISTAIYVGIFGIIFYESPWLDTRMAVQTEANDMMRVAYAALCALLGFIVCIFWMAWALEKNTSKNKENVH